MCSETVGARALRTYTTHYGAEIDEGAHALGRTLHITVLRLMTIRIM